MSTPSVREMGLDGGPTVRTAYRFDNGRVFVFDEHGEQIFELQGPYSEERRRAIVARSDEKTEYYGFPPDAPCSWEKRKEFGIFAEGEQGE